MPVSGAIKEITLRGLSKNEAFCWLAANTQLRCGSNPAAMNCSAAHTNSVRNRQQAGLLGTVIFIRRAFNEGEVRAALASGIQVISITSTENAQPDQSMQFDALNFEHYRLSEFSPDLFFASHGPLEKGKRYEVYYGGEQELVWAAEQFIAAGFEPQRS